MEAEYLIERPDEFTPEMVGIKAKNLVSYKLITPEFIVLSTVFFQDWRKSKGFGKEAKAIISRVAIYFQKKAYKKLILRSSATSEGISNRGKYISEISNTSVPAITSALSKIFEDFLKNSTGDGGLAIIAQAYKKPKVQGHLSNERRVDIDKSIWLIEREFDNRPEVAVERVTAKDAVSTFDYSINKCLNSNTLNQCLKFLTNWFCSQRSRYHIEWLWDGTNFWIVQIDIEPAPKRGTKPGSEWVPSKSNKKSLPKKNLLNFETLENVETTASNLLKIKCVKVFKECIVPFWDIFVLENPAIIKDLIKGEIELSLASDLKKLITSPIILRTDTRKSDHTNQKFEVLLPRTETISDYASATKFLVNNSKDFSKNGLKPNQFCFLIHRFIPTMAGALSYAKPNIDRVRIDSTWGIVEGLYFHPHDSFELRIADGKISKKLRCKDKYVDCDKSGKWYSKEAGQPYDWKQSLTDKQIREIGRITQKIADHLGKPVTVMFFINDKRYYPEILPWIYSEDEIPESDTNHTNVIFSDKRFVIESKEDFKELKKRTRANQDKSTVLLKLNSNLSRDKELIEEIASFAKESNYVIDIEGSILSHPYYVLYTKGVHVRCVDPLESQYSQKEFHKLVRDEIPVLIRNNEEEVLAINVSSSELLHLLKEKAVEEALELYWSRDNDAVVEEMADLLEVLVSACKAYKIEFNEIERIADKKRQKRGGFEKGVILVATKENSLFQLVTRRDSLFEERQSEIGKVKLRPTIRFFKKGEIDNYKSLTEVNKIHLSYINNLASKADSFRYLLKKDEYNSLVVEYKEKEIIITLEKADLEIDPSQLKLFDPKPKLKKPS